MARRKSECTACEKETQWWRVGEAKPKQICWNVGCGFFGQIKPACFPIEKEDILLEVKCPEITEKQKRSKR